MLQFKLKLQGPSLANSSNAKKSAPAINSLAPKMTKSAVSIARNTGVRNIGVRNIGAIFHNLPQPKSGGCRSCSGTR